MSFEVFTQSIEVWVTHYLALGCLASIILWGAFARVFNPQNWQPVRDAIVYFLAIGTLTIVLGYPHALEANVERWSALNWFCFSMLAILELLWMSMLIEGLLGLKEQHSVRNRPMIDTLPPYARTLNSIDRFNHR